MNLTTILSRKLKDPPETVLKQSLGGFNVRVSGKDEVPIHDLITFQRFMAGRALTVLNENGCHTNVISREIAARNRHLLHIHKRKSVVRHSKKDLVETTSEIFLDTELEIRQHRYRSNWIIADCRDDILWCMPWHVNCNPTANYRTRTVRCGEVNISVRKALHQYLPIERMGIKKFR